MAKATTDSVIRPVLITTTIFKTETVVTLEISQEEADTLYCILRNIAGCPINSPRKHAEAISVALLAGCTDSIRHRVLDNPAFSDIGRIVFKS